jgi:hypothetical protein
VHGQFERAGGQVAAQPDAESTDHGDQRIVDVDEVVQCPGNEAVDGGGGVGAQLAARLAATLDDGLRASTGRVLPCVHVVFDRAREVFTFGGGLR